MPGSVFRFAFDPRFASVLRLAGVRPDNCYVAVEGAELVARFGRWLVRTPRANVRDARVTGPYSALRAVGVRLSLADRGLTFGTNADAGVCVEFGEPVRGGDPFGLLRHPALTVTVAEPEALAAQLGRMCPGAR
ncbi:hypothetical protein SAMN05421810_11197 [Amycolatopsis arida]|uniref:Uncharacterized protein n=1 Tax=Amycolatopsis arida TaxID=587909 RepID=A0A1I6A5H3_9PSEU|nr:hypothetical protein [Amycolatopsis arida]TDX88597.1 hypothetical protein CLV69_111116 [Amycolatopsis arida]SFQ63984.1 hypothetical protein SAMN05421810_11197 [Amycolatopsis arida]